MHLTSTSCRKSSSVGISWEPSTYNPTYMQGFQKIVHMNRLICGCWLSVCSPICRRPGYTISSRTKRIKGNVMQQSNIFKELEATIEKDWLVKSLTEFDQMLKPLVQKKQITLADYRSLLE